MGDEALTVLQDPVLRTLYNCSLGQGVPAEAPTLQAWARHMRQTRMWGNPEQWWQQGEWDQEPGYWEARIREYDREREMWMGGPTGPGYR